ncbi:hypothetical protein [uncultured Mediterranean phage uvMED]|nr:hypothetical protein [uncultured Mediterranean phage uvMED]
MDINGNFNHIEDVLVNLHSGQWFGWSDSKNKVYENLIIHDESKDKPTKKFLEDELKKQQNEHDAKAYARSRSVAYDPIPEQLDQIYHDIDGWKAKIKSVKDKYPKP